MLDKSYVGSFNNNNTQYTIHIHLTRGKTPG